MIFNVSIALHAFYGPSWQVEVQGESLSWYKSCNGNVIEEKNIILTHSAIATFIKKCEELGVLVSLSGNLTIWTAACWMVHPGR